MNIKRIQPPMFLVKDVWLNEYELWHLLLDIAKKSIVVDDEFIDVTDDEGNHCKIDVNRVKLTDELPGLRLSDELALGLFMNHQKRF